MGFFLGGKGSFLAPVTWREVVALRCSSGIGGSAQCRWDWDGTDLCCCFWTEGGDKSGQIPMLAGEIKVEQK